MPSPRPGVRTVFAFSLSALASVPLLLTAVPAVAVTGPAAPSGDNTYAYSAQLSIGEYERSCSGVLVDAEWLLTAASCFADTPESSLSVPAGKPGLKTTATIGRANLTSTTGAVREVVELVPRTDRDVVLARLNRPVTNVSPIALATTAPTAGEELKFAGYGRTTTEWVPGNLHTGALSVDASAATTTTVTGKDSAAACMGDTGGPIIRVAGGTHQLAALSNRSYQGGCFGSDKTETRTGGIAARVDDLASWVDSKVGAPRITDFNCDGAEDIAVSDPKAAVGGKAGAGLVRIVYGDGKGTAEINQNLGWVAGDSETGDAFGESLATVDYDEDGCSDLVVGTPADDIGTVADAGMVDILHGAPNGIGTGSKKDTHFEQGAGTGIFAASASESGDRMGHALAAGTTTAGEPFLVIGVPGESVGTIAKAGAFFYLRGTTNVAVQQDSTDVSGTAEANDGFGAVITADANHFAVGAPNEAVGTATGAGALLVFDHKLNAVGKPTQLFGLDQDLDTVSGVAEAGDLFSESMAMVTYRPSGTAAATESILAVGSPGEDLAIDGVNRVDTGSVYTFRITAAGTYSQHNTYTTGTPDDDVAGTAEAGDQFGATLAAVNTAPRAVSTTSTMKMAVGAPNEALETETKAGAISAFSLLGTPGANDKWLIAGDGIPGAYAANQQVGTSLHFTGTQLYVGMPYGPSTYGALHALPVSNVTAGDTVAAVTTYQPGQDGLPAAGTDFGYLAR
ncbi:S1 family peptidase (plasmid) [Streptomyces sp. NBC_01220]|uniref:Trypsin-like serine protease n=1 Tax=Streptomyces poriferorum TaxID=2798799 RepID=A0ABY9J346_9ACTN|nr:MULTISPECIES: trypsin-like serine protease [unclassified Streptomyces]MDP5309335.1 trypsin-like serine protease [Streptomyces sp. Alt4]WLQ61459.1 trypsin-like serine protease [Streptomyces sp. Alt2]WSQ49299.1 S1 family peptidase [Streptomyces sp. NBC_01220]